MNEEALKELKRIRQETCPATYMPDFDKNKSCDVIEKALKGAAEEIDSYRKQFIRATNAYLDLKAQKTKKEQALDVFKEEAIFEFEEKRVMAQGKIITVYQVTINGILTIELTKEQFNLLKEVLL